ncbi:hypothetical protein GQ44DRAFT_825641 [Phaeosphaeriaceae sp. PMI808]|nr:hypothetical protein GQ44DRAFT_825641 [Phaeosphaeriaceae sp. PMI808]
MGLLDLPQEIFDQIVFVLTFGGSYHAETVAEYRLVCRTFNRCIAQAVASRCSKVRFTYLVGEIADKTFQTLFMIYGSEILTKRALSSREPQNNLLQFVRCSVVSLLRARSPQASELEKLRAQYTYQICKVLMTLDIKTLSKALLGTVATSTMAESMFQSLLPALAAAVGAIVLLKRSVKTYPELLLTKIKIFPNALDAAVASGKTKALSMILDYLQKHVKRRPEARTWNEMRTAAHTIGGALMLAMRLHRTDAGNLIFKFLYKDDAMRQSMPLSFNKTLVNEGIEMRNKQLLYGALVFGKRAYNPADYGLLENVQVDKSAMEFAFRSGNWGALRSLITNGFLDPNDSEVHKSPLYYALSYCFRHTRCQVASILLENGADPKAIVDGKSILWHTAKWGYYDEVRILLKFGAIPTDQDETLCPLSAASKENYKKCVFLIKKARDHGADYMKRVDLWNIYEVETWSCCDLYY